MRERSQAKVEKPRGPRREDIIVEDATVEVKLMAMKSKQLESLYKELITPNTCKARVEEEK